MGNYSISLMREKAIASTAIVEDGDFGLGSKIRPPRSRDSCAGCNFGSGVMYQTTRTSRRYIY
jgi:hypothetical protein